MKIGNSTAYAYDGNGNLTEVTDALGNRTAFEYDAINNCIREYRDAGEEKECIMLYQYDKRSCMIKEINPLLEETGYSYDGNGNMTEIVDGEQNRTVVTYDLNNLPTRIQYGTDMETRFRYNSRGQLVEMQSSAYTYDSAGNLVKAVQPGNTVSYTYDKNNRPVTVERLFGVDTRASEQITYDALGRITTHTGTSSVSEYAFGRSYTYDALGRLARGSAANGAIVGAARGSRVSHSNGNITEIVDEEQNKTVVTYDLNTYIFMKKTKYVNISSFFVPF